MNSTLCNRPRDSLSLWPRGRFQPWPPRIPQAPCRPLARRPLKSTKLGGAHPEPRSSSRFEAFHSDPWKNHSSRVKQWCWGEGEAFRRDLPPVDAYQVEVVEDEGGLVHLTQDEQHLIVNEFLEFFQIAAHLLLQLVPDLPRERERELNSGDRPRETSFGEGSPQSSSSWVYFFGSHVLQIFAHHDAPELGLDQPFCPLSLGWPGREGGRKEGRSCGGLQIQTAIFQQSIPRIPQKNIKLGQMVSLCLTFFLKA